LWQWLFRLKFIWLVASCNLVSGYKHFGGACLHIQSQSMWRIIWVIKVFWVNCFLIRHRKAYRFLTTHFNLCQAFSELHGITIQETMVATTRSWSPRIRVLIGVFMTHWSGFMSEFGITGLFTVSIIRYSKEHNISETGSVSVLRWGGRWHLLCWAY
jgi:hypothetical protein